MERYRTEQEKFWVGNFGDAYVDRNGPHELLPSYRHVWNKILRIAEPIESAIEFGPNIGLNLMALNELLPEAKLSCVEINKKAIGILNRLDCVEKVHEGSILEFKLKEQMDLSFTRGVLIHIEPDSLPACYDLLYHGSKRYILIDEYYNPSPVTVAYHGHQERLFKRDFACELMARYPDVKLVDYGFTYHKDPEFPLDDTTWFLMEKMTGV